MTLITDSDKSAGNFIIKNFRPMKILHLSNNSSKQNDKKKKEFKNCVLSGIYMMIKYINTAFVFYHKLFNLFKN